MKKPRKLYKKVLFWVLGLPLAFLLLAVGTLIFPGWSAGPLLGIVENAAEKQFVGLDLELERLYFQVGMNGDLTVETGGLLVGDQGGDSTVALKSARLVMSLGRLINSRIMPREVKVNGFEVWVRMTDNGQVVLPNWLGALTASAEADEAPEPEPLSWDDIQLGKIPLILKLEEGDAFSVAMEDYAAHLLRGSESSSFRLPSLYVDLVGRVDGVDINWSTVGWESGGNKLVSGKMAVNVPAETIVWRNRLNLPLTPELTDWLRAGFPFLPIPPYLETGVHLFNEGTIDVRSKSMHMEGEFTMDAGRLVLPQSERLSFGIPRVEMVFESDIAMVAAQPLLVSALSLKIGEGDGAGVIQLNAEVDAAQDRIQVSSLGLLSGLDELLSLLPVEYRPVELRGDVQWDAQLETVYSAPAAIRIGAVELKSGGIEISFAGREQPLSIASFAFGGRVEQAGKQVHVAPFHLEVGPLKVRGSGLDWQADDQSRTSEGFITLEGFGLAEILAELPDGLVVLPEELSRFLDTVELKGAQLEIAIGPWESGSDAIGVRLQPQWEWLIAGQSLRGGGRVRARIHDPVAEWDLKLAEFNPLGMQLPYIRDYLELDSVLSAVLEGNFALDSLAGEGRLKLASSSGQVLPASGLQQWLSLPIGLGDSHLVANIGYEEGVVYFGSEARGRSVLGSLDCALAVEPLNIAELEAAVLSSGLVLRIDPADTRILLDLLNPAVLSEVPLTVAELADFGIGPIQFELGFSADQLNQPLPALRDLSFDGSLELKVGKERLQFSAEGGVGRERGPLAIEWRMPEWDIGKSDLALAARLPVPLSVLRFPVSVKGTVDMPWNGDPTALAAALPELVAELEVAVVEAGIGVNPYLAAPLEIPLASLHITTHPMAMQVDAMEAEMRFMDGLFFVTGKALRLGDALTGHISGGGNGLSFDWIPACIPMDRIPEAVCPYLEALVLKGGLESARFAVDLGESATEQAIPMVADFSASVVLADLGVQQSKIPELGLQRLELTLSPDELTLSVTQAGHPFAMLERADVAVKDYLKAEPLVQLTAQSRHDLDAIDAILNLLPDPEPITAAIAAFGIDGVITNTYDAVLRLEPSAFAFEAAANVNLKDFAIAVDGLSRAKVAGEAAGMQAQVTGRLGLPGKGESSKLHVDTELRGLFLDFVGLGVGCELAADFEGPFGGLQSARFNFSGMDYSDVSGELSVIDDAMLELRLMSHQLNLGPLLQLVEPIVLKALTPAAEDALASAPVTEPELLPESDPNPATAPKSIPALDVSIELNRIQFGSVGSVGPFRLATKIKDAFPASLEFEFANAEDWIRFAFQPDGQRRTFFFNLGNLAHWIEAAVLPLYLFNSETALANPTLAAIKQLPTFFANGDLSFDGYFALQPSLEVLLSNLSLAGLVLQAEVPFLSKIAALVNRSVVLQIPFTEFRFATIQANPRSLQVVDGFMDGPINLAIQKVDVDLETLNLLFQGKVFGVDFEVIGTPPDLQFYLQEKGTVIKTITTEDDFEW